MIRKITVAFLCGMGLLLIQNLFLPIFLGERFSPNLITIMVVFLAMYHSNQLGLFIVFLLGILLDLTYAELLGVWSGSYIVTFSVLLLLSQHLFVESRMVVFIATTFCALLTEVMYLLISGKFPLLDPLFVLQGLLISVITGFASIVLFPILQKILPDTDARKRY